MSFKFQPFDDFIRNKEQEIPANMDQADLHWQQLQQLIQPGPSSIKPGFAKRIRPVMKYAAVVIAGIVMTALYLSRNKGAQQTNNHSTEKKSGSVSNAIIRFPVKDSLPAVANKPSGNYPYYHSLKETYFKNRQLPAINVIVTDSFVYSTGAGNSIPDNKKIFAAFYQQLEKKADEFSIKTNRDTIIYCTEGTTLSIPANSFETASGVGINGAIRLSVKEFYALSDIIGNKLTTVSNGKPLASGGMLNITANINGESVNLKPGAAIQLNMPTKLFDPSMQLFTGQEIPGGTGTQNPLSAINTAAFSTEQTTDILNSGNNAFFVMQNGINWMEAGQQQTFIKDKRKMITLLNLTDNPFSISPYRNNTKTLGKFSIPYNCPLSIDEVKGELEKKYGDYYDRIKIVRQHKSIFRSAKKEKALGVPFNDWYNTHTVGDSISVPLKYAVRMRMITREDSIRYEEQYRLQYEAAMKRKEDYHQYLEIREKYSFSISNLGWINCDRFINYPLSRITEFAVQTGEGFDSDFMNATVILKKQNAALAGHWENGTIYFAKLPLGEEVNIVCVGAKAGKMYGCVQSMVVERKKIPVLQLEEITPDEFRQRLSSLGNVSRLN
jgi:hypothetical protein